VSIVGHCIQCQGEDLFRLYFNAADGHLYRYVYQMKKIDLVSKHFVNSVALRPFNVVYICNSKTDIIF